MDNQQGTSGNQFSGVSASQSTSPDASRIYQGGIGEPLQPVDGAPVMPASTGSRFSIASLLRIVMRYWTTVLLLAILGATAGVIYIQVATPVYQARAELEMSVRRPKVIDNTAVYEDTTLERDTDVIFNTRFKKFTSPAMEKLAAGEYIKLYPNHKSTSRGVAIDRYSLAAWVRDIHWDKDPEANIVEVSYAGSDPEFVARLVNVVSHCAGLLMMQENQAESDEAVKWLVTQAQEQRDVVEGVETQLASLREELMLDSLDQQKAALGQALITVSEEREALISELESRSTVYDFVVGLKELDHTLEMLPSGLPKEADLADLIRDWREANDNLLLAADRYTDIHPEYRKAAEIESRSRKRLDRFIEMSTKAVENEIALLKKQIEQMSSRIDGMKEDVVELEKTLSEGMRKVQQLERERDAADKSYLVLLRRMEEARISADENMAFAKVIRNASVPRSPIKPSRIQALAVSVLGGGFAGCAIAILLAFWTDKVGSITDLKSYGLNVLAVIPSQKKIDSRGQLATIALRDKFNPLVEIFSGVNAMICSERYANHSGLLMMCSIEPGAGKTISACNLAICSANNGMRTLLIDADLRRPQIANIFRIDESQPSLISWLAESDGTGYEALVCRDVVDNLDVISSRPDPNVTPAELLGRGNLSGLLSWAREHYDRVILDTPPLGPVGDAQVLANLVDSVILVVRIDHTRHKSLLYAINRFRQMEVNMLGCIANDVPHAISGMFGGGEGYGYGYGSYKHYGA